MDQVQTYSPKCTPKRLPNETLLFIWDGSAHSAHNTTNSCDLSALNQEQISLVETFLSIL